MPRALGDSRHFSVQRRAGALSQILVDEQAREDRRHLVGDVVGAGQPDLAMREALAVQELGELGDRPLADVRDVGRRAHVVGAPGLDALGRGQDHGGGMIERAAQLAEEALGMLHVLEHVRADDDGALEGLGLDGQGALGVEVVLDEAPEGKVHAAVLEVRTEVEADDAEGRVQRCELAALAAPDVDDRAGPHRAGDPAGLDVDVRLPGDAAVGVRVVLRLGAVYVAGLDAVGVRHRIPIVGCRPRTLTRIKAAARRPTTRAMTHPTVSVIIPCFNYEQWVAGAVRSALEQDWPAIEVIAVDDGSTDGTPEVLASFGDAIRVIRRPNGGLNAATSTGMEHATGEFITFLDADDEWQPNRCRVLAEALIANPDAGLAYGDMEVVDTDGRTVAPSFREAYRIEPRAGRVLGRLLAGNFISAGSLMVRSSLRELYHPIPDVAAWQDWWIASRVATVADVVPIAEPVNRYRLHGTNMNLGQTGEGFAKLCRTELPFRRFLLTTTEASLVSAGDLVAGLGAYDHHLAALAQLDRRPVSVVAPTSEQERAQADAAYAEGLDALEADGAERALPALVRAAALVPGWGEVRALIEDLVPVIAGEVEPAPEPRRLPVALDAHTALSTPAVLTAWAHAFSGADDVSLVVCGLRESAHVHMLVALAEQCGLDRPDAADVITVEERHPAAVAARLGRSLAATVADAASVPALATALREQLAAAP